MSKLKADWQEEAKNLGIPLEDSEGNELTIAELEAAIKAKQNENPPVDQPPPPPPPEESANGEQLEAKQKSEEEKLIEGLTQQVNDLQAKNGTLETELSSAKADLAEATELLKEWEEIGKNWKESEKQGTTATGEDKYNIDLKALEGPLPKDANKAIIENRQLRVKLNEAARTLKDYRNGWVDRESYNTLSNVLAKKSAENRKLVQEKAELEAQIEKRKSSDKKD